MEGFPQRPAPTVLLGEDSGGVPPTGDSALPAPGSKLGPYTITAKIGEGGMGVVFRAEDTLLNRTVALKVLPPHLFRSPEYLERFRIEAQAQARLHSPNVVTLYAMLEDRAGLVLVMEYVEGETLDQRIRAHGPLAVDEALRIFDQALLGVEQAHRLGIVHRDLKPANIFITADRGVKIMDFGVAKLADRKEFTSAGSRIGTLLYISPEQVQGGEADARSDIYTLGTSLFEALTGRAPFLHDGEFALMRAHLEETPPRPGTLRADIPPELEAAVLRAIEKQPRRRYASAADFRKALLGCRRKIRVLPRAPQPPAAAPEPLATIPGRFQSMARRLFARHSLFGHLGLDLLLVLAIAGLVLFLGLYPRSKPEPDAPSAAGAESAASAKGAPAARAPAPSSGKPARDSQPPGSPPKDKYEDLRKAWGGG